MRLARKSVPRAAVIFFLIDFPEILSFFLELFLLFLVLVFVCSFVCLMFCITENVYSDTHSTMRAGG